MAALKKPLIAARKPNGIRRHSRLGRIMAKLDHRSVCYRIRSNDDVDGIDDVALAGWGELRVESADDLLWCRVDGEVQRRNAYEFVLQHFWLTRRGMLQVLLGLLASRTPEERLTAGETFVQLVVPDRQLTADALMWLRRWRTA